MASSEQLPAGLSWAHLTQSVRLEEANRDRWQQINECVRRMAVSPTVLLAVERLLAVTREEFKALSHRGALYMGKGRYRDAGNWTYSVVYLLLCSCSQGTELESAFRELMWMYSSLDATAPYTYASLEMQGDVIESILERCRDTGPSVDKQDRDERLAVHKDISIVCKQTDELRKVISNFERVPDKDWPAPALFVSTVHSILGV